MIVRSFEEKDRDTFLKLCCDFYNAHATLMPFNKEVANKFLLSVIVLVLPSSVIVSVLPEILIGDF